MQWGVSQANVNKRRKNKQKKHDSVIVVFIKGWAYILEKRIFMSIIDV